MSNLERVPITVAYGDGIGPEIMGATLRVLEAAGARLEIEPIEIGESVYLRGRSSGIEPSAWDSLRRTRVFLKGPVKTPQGGGYKSLNVTVRKTLGLYANVRPTVAYAPFVPTRHPGMDIVVIRENEEDLYAGIEHRQTDDVMQCLKLITRPGCELIVTYAFEYARKNGRKKITCFTKDNIMKLTDGLFHRVFDEIGASYPEIEREHMLVDVGAATVADTPEVFDMIVAPNLYGDVVSHIAAQIAGSSGLAGAANIGTTAAMFEPVSGTAPEIAGQDIANPSGMLQAATLMLGHIGQDDIAAKIQNAWLKTIEDGIHTFDIYSPGTSKKQVGTQEFADAVIARLGETPSVLRNVRRTLTPYRGDLPITPSHRPPAVKKMVGIDVFVHLRDVAPATLAERLIATETPTLHLTMITSRGVQVWPTGFPETGVGDHWRCRFMATDTATGISHRDLMPLFENLTNASIDFIKTEGLCTFDGEPGYALGQGQ